MMKAGRRALLQRAAAWAGAGWLGTSISSSVLAQQVADSDAPDALIARLSSEVLETIRGDSEIRAGNVARIEAVVDSKIMPNVDFVRMTASAVGPAWRRATPGQRSALQEQFKQLLIRTYAGALRQVDSQRVEVLPLRAGANDAEVIVRTRILGGAEPVQVDYRLERAPGKDGGWRIFDLNVLGIWLVANYRTQFSQEINQNGIDGLIAALIQRNRVVASTG